MLVRNLVMIASLVGFLGAILLQFLKPEFATYIFYGLLLWVVASLFIYRLPGMNRNVGGGAAQPAPIVRAAPPAFGPGSSPPVEVGFCTSCGTNVEPGTALCPACGRTITPI